MLFIDLFGVGNTMRKTVVQIQLADGKDSIPTNWESVKNQNWLISSVKSSIRLLFC